MKSFFRKRQESFSFAIQGLKIALRQPNFKIMICIAVIVMGLAGFWGISREEWLILLLIIGIVLSLEVLNTTVETLLDLVQPQFSPKVKVVKDLVAGAVLISILVSVTTGIIIFLPKFLNILKTKN
ncbi:diacylglycerol kinase family protein [bacterium]|nr:diacylglycerol kinase family protein [bacterium]